MVHLNRMLEIDLPRGQSAFLWGARRVGKTTLLRDRFPGSLRYDLLLSDVFFELSTRPQLLREQLLARKADAEARPVILDEVQKAPQVLDEVHWLIENHGIRFILCGSSARKLKRSGVNLLGGRAWRFELRPFVTAELDQPPLLRMLNHGLIPDHYLQDDPSRSLRAYTSDYLKQEVFAEGLTRNVPAFSRFFEAMAFSHGELINYSGIARDTGVDSKTVKEYFQILVDTLLGRFVLPFARRSGRQVISRAPKFYMFDVGVAGTIQKRVIAAERGELFGRALEHLIFMELDAHRVYRELDHDISFWRTKRGMEVDFVLGGGEVAVEVKGTDRADRRDLRGLLEFAAEHHPRESYLVCTERRERLVEGIRVIPWREFLRRLWAGEIVR
jgi:uncharacterized protein